MHHVVFEDDFLTCHTRGKRLIFGVDQTWANSGSLKLHILSHERGISLLKRIIGLKQTENQCEK